jgi:DNA-directed RNA polymerase specialized sigma24 family protein
MRSLRRDHDFIVTLEETVAEATAHEAECVAGNGGAGEWTLERFLACLTREDLCAAYQQLNRREQAIIAWSFGGGETNARIAARLGENVEAIKKARQRAIHQMAGEAAGADGRGARSGNSPAHGGVRAAA